MERWLTKPRAVFGLCAVLLVAALNRQEPMVYAMFLVLVALGGLGYLLPWLSLRAAALQQGAAWPDQSVVMQDQSMDLGLRLQQRAWWPAWVVEVVAGWEWGGREFESRSTVPLLAPGRSIPVLDGLAFGCRGRYRLVSLRLRSGFPLGLVHARRDVSVGRFEVLVQPGLLPVQLPAEWTLSEDALADATEGHSGESLELNMLRPHEPGQPVRRIDWRASARAGDLVVRQFQHPASPLVHLAVPIPGRRDVGIPESAAEQAIRVAASACDLLERASVRFMLMLPNGQPQRDAGAAARELAGAVPTETGWPEHLLGMSARLRRGEQLVAVVPVDAEVQPLLDAARNAHSASARLVVVIALWPGAAASAVGSASRLQAALRGAGLEAWQACR